MLVVLSNRDVPFVATEITDADGNAHSDIDLDVMREHFDADVEGQRERYQFAWPDKRAVKMGDQGVEAEDGVYQTRVGRG